MSNQLQLNIPVKNPISEKLAAQLGDWTGLYPFFEGPEWPKIKEVLRSDMSRITPPVDVWFKAFRCCPPKDLKVIFLGMSPYYTVDSYMKAPVADGLAFSTDTRHSVPPSLFKLYKAIEQNVWNGLNLKMERSNNLEWLAGQGVLLLNSALTTVYDDSKAHLMTWKPFIYAVIKYLNENYTDLVFVGFGTHANELLQRVSRTNEIIELEHPAASAYEHRAWKHEDVFTRINDYLSAHNKSIILWDKYLVDLECPF